MQAEHGQAKLALGVPFLLLSGERQKLQFEVHDEIQTKMES